MYISRSLPLFIIASIILGIANSVVQPLTNAILSGAAFVLFCMYLSTKILQPGVKKESAF